MIVSSSTPATVPVRPLRAKRFSLRTLFALMTVSCIVLGLWSVYVNPFRRQAQSLAVVNRLQGDFEWEGADGPAWHRWLVTTLLGERAFVHVTKVDLSNRKVGDDELTALSGLIFVNEMRLEHTQVGDDGAAALSSMKELSSLSLSRTRITDGGLKSLASLPRVEQLALTGTKISNAAAYELAKLQSLRELYIRWTQVTAVGAQTIEELLPNCAVYYHELVDDTVVAER
jgi:hypothetical protein